MAIPTVKPESSDSPSTVRKNKGKYVEIHGVPFDVAKMGDIESIKEALDSRRKTYIVVHATGYPPISYYSWSPRCFFLGDRGFDSAQNSVSPAWKSADGPQFHDILAYINLHCPERRSFK